jgi:hypothetical protein
MKRTLLAFSLSFAFVVAPAIAQDAASEVQPDKVITIEEPDTLTAGREGPKTALITVTADQKVESLIQIRDSFDDQITDSAHDL